MRDLLTESMLMIAFTGVALGALYTVSWLHKRANRLKRSPLTHNLLRAPGHSLRIQLNALHEDILTTMIAVLLIPFVIILVVSSRTENLAHHPALLTLVVIFAMAGMLIAILPLNALLKKISRIKLALDGETAIGQELNQLMRQGCRVFHDFPADGFNIDHIVIGPAGGFAVETKTRTKRIRHGAPANVNVRFDGEKLNFPNHAETQPVEQAWRQARWLAQWLRQAAGETVEIRPVIALPGWYVQSSAKNGGLLVINGKNPQALIHTGKQAVLNEAQIRRLAYAVEQKCRDIAPFAAKKR